MEWLSRLNVLQDKISGLLKVVSQLKADNERKAQENALLQEETARLKEGLETLKKSSAQYMAERDNIRERVERLIEMID